MPSRFNSGCSTRFRTLLPEIGEPFRASKTRPALFSRKPEDPQQRYFTEEQLRKIIEGAEGQYRVLFALLAGTGMRIGEASGLHVADLDLDNCVIYVRRGVWNGQELSPKTRNAIREIDIDPGLAELLKLVRFDGVAVRFPHLKRRPLQIGYKLLHYLFINGVQGQGTESGKDVFGELTFHAQYGTWFPVRPSLVIPAAPFDTLPEGDNGFEVH
jgi:integrase